MTREERAYDPPKPKKDRSGLFIRTVAIALLTGAAALIGVYVMNTPTDSLTPPSDQVSALRAAPPRFHSFEDTSAPAPETSAAEDAAPTSASTPAPTRATLESSPAVEDSAAEPRAPEPLPIQEATTAASAPAPGGAELEGGAR